VNSLPKTVTGQRRGCDLNPGPSVPGSSTLTTRLPLCQKLTDNYLILIKSQRRLYVTRAGHLPSPQTHVPRKSQSRTSTHHTYPNANQGVVSMIAVSRGGATIPPTCCAAARHIHTACTASQLLPGGAGVGGQISDHRWCLSIRVCGD